MVGAFLSCVLAATDLSVAVLPFNAVDVAAAKGEVLSEHLATRLLEYGGQVTTPKDLGAVLGFERQKQLLGCSEGSCVAELAGALGVKELVHGEVVRVDGGFRLLVKVISAESGRPRFARTRAADTERALFEALDEWAPLIAGREPPRTSWAPLVPIVGGGAALATGAGFLISSALSWSALQRRGDAALPLEGALAARANGERDQWLGVALAGAGALALAAGLVWSSASRSAPPPTVWLAPQPNGLAVGGAW
ncbi:MAG: hypothetical protein ACOZQL_24235 [Myxococcota bacterium]